MTADQQQTSPGAIAATRRAPPLTVCLDAVPLHENVMPSLRKIVNREITPEQHARAIMVDELQRVKRWRDASLTERGDTIAGLLDLVSAMNRFPPQTTEFPGFPGSHKRPKRSA